MNNKKPQHTNIPVQPKGTVNISIAELLRYVKQDHFMSSQQVEAHLNLKPGEANRLLPEQLRYRIGSRVRYRLSEVDAWMDTNKSGRSLKALESITDEVIRKIRSKSA